MGKERLDVLLVKRNLVDSREKAKRLIMAGLVYTENERLDKPGMKVDDGISLHVKETLRYVGRGGFKLEKALLAFDVTIANKIVVDIGASTGGFTDCALQNGAKLVYAIDVGYNQLAWKLRSDQRVVVHERTNFRYVSPQLFSEGLPNFATIDVSFISLTLILPVLKTIIQPNSDIIALVKPQFEAKKEQVGKKGVIRNQQIHREILEQLITFAINEQFTFVALTFSPITGGEGNIEYLLHLRSSIKAEKYSEATYNINNSLIRDVVKLAHKTLYENGR